MLHKAYRGKGSIALAKKIPDIDLLVKEESGLIVL